MSEIAKWLSEANLEKYAETFRAAAIEMDVVGELSEADLIELGLPLGDRRRLRRLLKMRPPAGVGTGSTTATDIATMTAEHRQITVLFCDLVGWTALSRRHNPEDLSDALNECRALWTAAIERYDGFVAQHLGDGLMAYFGHPQAHEDDAERAILAGLDIVAAMEQLQQSKARSINQSLAIRVGIATGKVLVNKTTTGALKEVDVLGYTPNFAARLQALASANSVLVSATTASLARHRFHFAERADVEIKGVEGKVSIFEVIRRVRSDEVLASYVDSLHLPVVGRMHEIGLLEDRWHASQQGEGQVVILSGEAGIGKSRTADTLFEKVNGFGTIRIRLNCSSYYSNSSLHPIVDYVLTRASIADNDPPTEKSKKLNSFLLTRNISDEQDHLLFADLLSIPGDIERLPTMSSERQKKETFKSIAKLLLHAADIRPTVIIFEDAHWADPTSLELLEALSVQVQSRSALLIVTTRDDQAMPFKKLPNVTSLQLSRLTRSQASEIIRNISPQVPLADMLVDQILEKSDGIPLFLEEITKTVCANVSTDGNTDPADTFGQMSIPASLYDSLMSRLDSFPEMRNTVGCAATIGREFSGALLADVLKIGQQEAQRRCTILIEAGLVFQHRRRSEASYIFKHALVQDAVYESMTRSDRKALHGKIAASLQGAFPNVVEQAPEILAQHYDRAGDAENAATYWEKAGRFAMEHSATKEATAHLKRAIDILDTQPDEPARIRRKMSLLTAYGAALTSVKGYTASETVDAYQRAWALSEAFDDPSYFHEIIYGMWNSAQVGSDYDYAQSLADMCLKYANKNGDDVSCLVAYNLCGVTAVLRGHHESAGKYLEKSVEIYDPVRFQSLALSTGEDPGVESMSYLALNRWFVGDAKAALGYADRSITMARELAYQHSLIYALSMTGALLHFVSMPDDLIRRADEIISLAKKQDYPFFVEWAQNLKGWALVENGQHDEGAALMANKWDQGFSKLLLSKVCLRTGQIDEGLDGIDRLIASQPCYAPEAQRVKGELLLLGSDEDRKRARQCFLDALRIAKGQGAASLALRAAISLARSETIVGMSDETTDTLRQSLTAVKDNLVTRDLLQANELLNARMKRISTDA